MNPRPEDLAFAAFRQSADPTHLGQVFDQVAGKLLILAVHLTRAPADAEDLVQATFVAAIESASRWDPGQPVLPWLTGILANLIRMRARTERRPLAPERLSRAAAEQPLDAAALRELSESVAQAIDGLDEVYRAVLVLRLVHGLRPVEIAHALSRSPETVRTQLHRGLALLRDRLPKSLGVGALAGALLATRGLAAVRRAVVEHGARAAVGGVVAAGSGLVLGGLVLMKKVVLASVAALVVLGLVGWQVAELWSRPADAGAVSAPESAPVSQPALAAGEAARREPRAEASLATGVAAPDGWLRGRCVAAESGLPLAGARLTVSGVTRGPKPSGWRRPEEQRTGPDGRFAVRFGVPAEFGLRAELQADDRVTLQALWITWTPGSGVDVGDVLMPAGVPVRGVVRDRAGAVQAQIAFLAKGPVLSFGTQPGSLRETPAKSRGDGSLDFGRLLPGVWTLKLADARTLRLQSPREFTVRGTDPRVELDVVVAPYATDEVLAGVVVDEREAPALGITVRAWNLRGESIGSATTEAEGRFAVPCDAEAGSTAWLELTRRDGTTAGHDPTQFAVGRRDLRLVLRDDAKMDTLIVQVVDAVTQEPVERFGVRCRRDPTHVTAQFNSSENRLRLGGAHPGGVLAVDEVPEGPVVLLVEPEDPSHQPSGPIRFTTPLAGPLRVALRRPLPLPVEVVRQDGTPVAGTRVELLHPWGDGLPDLHILAQSLEKPFTTCCPKVQAFLRHAATTDARGRTELIGPAGQPELSLRVMGPGCMKKLVHPVTWRDTGTPLRIVVESGGTLTGRVDPPDFFERLARMPASRPGVRNRSALPTGLLLAAVGHQAQKTPPLGESSFGVAANGEYWIDGIPPGRWSVLGYWWPDQGVGGRMGTRLPDLATVDLREGQVLRLDLDLRDRVPARLSCRVLLDGEPLTGAGVGLAPLRGPQVNQSLWRGYTDEEGGITFEVVPPNLYRVYSGKNQACYAEDDLLVEPGADLQREVRLHTRRVRVTLLTHDDRPAPAGTTLRWTSALGIHYSGIATTGDDGVLVFEPAPALPADITVRIPATEELEFVRLPEAEQARRTVTLGTVAVPPSGTREIPITLRLPAPAR